MKQIILAAVIAAATPALAETYHTVDWFLAHPTERAQTLAECQNNIGLWDRHPNCTNANEAKIKADWHALNQQLPTFDTIDQAEIDSCRWFVRNHVQLPPNRQALCNKALGGGG